MMKSKFFLCLFACCLVLLTGCGKDEREPKPSEATRTVLAYLAADNSLKRFALDDLKEMKIGMESMAGSNVHLLVYIDTGDSPKLVELKYKKGEVVEELVKSYEDRNSVGVEETKEVFRDVFFNEAYKARSYGLIYWSHGDGWIPEPLPSSRWIGQDTGSGTNYMNISDLVLILSSAAPHLDFVLFDACFMQSIEVAYALRHYTDYYLGSPTEIPGPGASYDVLVPAMFADGDVAMNVASAYYEPYAEIYTGDTPTNSHWTGGVSVGALKCSELETLAAITRQVLSENRSSEAVDTKSLRSVFNYDQRDDWQGMVGYFDTMQLMRKLVDDAGFAAWTQAYDAALVYWKTTPKNYSAIGGMFSMEGSNGVSHYIPSPLEPDAAKAYHSTDWYLAAGLEQLGW